MANHLRAELAVDTSERAIGQRRPRDVIRHSDQECRTKPSLYKLRRH
jgi:hypothetical protein